MPRQSLGTSRKALIPRPQAPAWERTAPRFPPRHPTTRQAEPVIHRVRRRSLGTSEDAQPRLGEVAAAC
ncbi:hypothetical protein RISK_004330 [Rhodopirellula islandica]|uniref:Uncharacterized protein n=1 Tax=Rhodopirellula islandica TaxID=595434 RepID=A0A0J1BBL1_RHOIS|nr:hypothetical protein RISK_004330 [Rhodopirellula islandica]